MVELLTVRSDLDDHAYSNDLTKEMDKYLIFDNTCHIRTYIYGHKALYDKWILRYPGATRGHIEVDKDEIITNIILYDTAVDTVNSVGCYKPEVAEAIKRFIGAKLVFIGVGSTTH